MMRLRRPAYGLLAVLRFASLEHALQFFVAEGDALLRHRMAARFLHQPRRIARDPFIADRELKERFYDGEVFRSGDRTYLPGSPELANVKWRPLLDEHVAL